MSKEATFQEIFLTSSKNINDYVGHIYREDEELDKKNRVCGRG